LEDDWYVLGKLKSNVGGNGVTELIPQGISLMVVWQFEEIETCGGSWETSYWLLLP